jgi:hypothetical protein
VPVRASSAISPAMLVAAFVNMECFVSNCHQVPLLSVTVISTSTAQVPFTLVNDYAIYNY